MGKGKGKNPFRTAFAMIFCFFIYLCSLFCFESKPWIDCNDYSNLQSN